MSRRRSLMVAVLALVALVVHVLLVRWMAHGHIAHVLLGSGNAAPPMGAALLAASLVVARFAAVVIAPGALLAALTSLVAHALMGPPRGGRGQGEEDGTGTSSGTGKKPGGKGSGAELVADGTAMSIDGRAT